MLCLRGVVVPPSTLGCRLAWLYQLRCQPLPAFQPCTELRVPTCRAGLTNLLPIALTAHLPLPRPSCSPITILSGQSSTFDQGSVCVTGPSAGGPFVQYNCTACYNGQCGAPQPCGDRRRRLLGAGPCDATGSTECFLNSLESTTPYT